jgi:hypothetical protein
MVKNVKFGKIFSNKLIGLQENDYYGTLRWDIFKEK